MKIVFRLCIKTTQNIKKKNEKSLKYERIGKTMQKNNKERKK